MKQLGFQMTEHEEARWTPNPHMQGHRWKSAWNCAICAWLWSSRAWQSRLWCLMGPAQHSPPSNISVSLRVIGHRSRPGMERTKRQKSRQEARQPHEQLLTQPQPSANTKKKAGFDLPTPSRGENPAWGKGMGRGSLKRHREPEWHRQEEMHSTDYPALLSNPNSGEGHLFLPITKLLQKRRRACILITYSYVNLAFHKTGRWGMCKERRSQCGNKFRPSAMIYYSHLPTALL